MKRQARNSKSMGTEISITYTQLRIAQRRSYSSKNRVYEHSRKVRLKDLKSSAQWEATHCGGNHLKQEGSSLVLINIFFLLIYFILIFIYVISVNYFYFFYLGLFNFYVLSFTIGFLFSLGLVFFIFETLMRHVCEKWIPY